MGDVAHKIEQGLSGGKGWGGLGKNVGAVVSAPFTGGKSLGGSQWAENALAGQNPLGDQSGSASKQDNELLNSLGGMAINQRKEDINQSAYRDYLNRAKQMSETGESRFLQETADQNPMLDVMKQQMTKGIDEQKRTTTSDVLAQQQRQGIRGGQAGIALNRAVGDVGQRGQNEMNTMLYNDYLRRNQARTGYFAGQAQQGQGSQFKLEPKYI